MKYIQKADYIDGEKMLSKALTILMDNSTAVFVVKKGKYIGLIDDRNVNSGIRDTSKIKCSKLAVKSPILTKSSSLSDEIEAFSSGKYKALPVLSDGGKLIGMATKVELMKELVDEHLITPSPLMDFVKIPIYNVKYTSTVGNARKVMKNKKVHKLLVLSNGKPRGFISTFDLSALILKPRKRDRAPIISEVKNLNNKLVSEIIRERIYSVKLESTLLSAVELMIKKNVSNLLVVKNSKPVGVFSSTDLFKKLKTKAKREWRVIISGLNKEEDKHHYPLVMKKCEGLMVKYAKSLKIKELFVHFKSKKSVYEVSAKLILNKKSISFSKEWPEIPYLMNYLVKEINSVLLKMKSKKKASKKMRK